MSIIIPLVSHPQIEFYSIWIAAEALAAGGLNGPFHASDCIVTSRFGSNTFILSFEVDKERE